MPMPQQSRVSEIKLSLGEDSGERQRRQMLIALTLLLAALIVILTKDRKFWFPSAPAVQTESEPLEDVSPARAPQSTSAKTATPPIVRRRQKMKPGVDSGAEPNPAVAVVPLVASRAVLPPLEVEVVAGDEHRTIEGSSNSVKVDLQSRTPLASAQEPLNPTGVSDASGRVRLSPRTAEIVSLPVEPDYPLLAKQMKVQGAVVMKALIGREGNIQHLQVLSGPSILSTAAREAVKQWRFRPYLQSGQAVETETRITVNFTIWTR